MPPIPNPHRLLMPTIIIMVSMTMLAQSILIGLSTRIIKSYKGVWEASIAAALLSASFFIIAVSRKPPMPLEAWLSTILQNGGYFLIYFSICRFTKVKADRWIIYFLAPLCLVIFAVTFLTGASVSILRMTGLFFGFIVFVRAGLILMKSDTRQFLLSARISVVTLFMLALSLIFNFISGLFSIETVLPKGTLVEKISIILLFIITYFWTGAFIMMISQRLQSDLNDLAMNDALTRVRNRRAMDKLLTFEMKRVGEEVKHFSIILMDIDHFKKVNDTYGHDTGDLILQWFASTIQSSLRVQDVVARWGGEEFLVLLPDTSLETAAAIAERIRRTVEESEIPTADTSLSVTFSAGVSSTTENRDVKSLCKVADLALYKAKETRNRIVTQDEIKIPSQGGVRGTPSRKGSRP